MVRLDVNIGFDVVLEHLLPEQGQGFVDKHDQVNPVEIQFPDGREIAEHSHHLFQPDQFIRHRVIELGDEFRVLIPLGQELDKGLDAD